MNLLPSSERKATISFLAGMPESFRSSTRERWRVQIKLNAKGLDISRPLI
jgi:hypothetical protein